MAVAREVASAILPTPFGEFRAHAFEDASGPLHLALVRGEVFGQAGVMTRLHSECLTGDALSSLRCDCGTQLRLAMHMIAAEGQGVLVYMTGHEGRGVGLVNKLRAYAEQQRGADTVDANMHLGLPVDSRRYDGAVRVLRALGVRSVRLLTNNPVKVEALRTSHLHIDSVEPIATSAHARNLRYLQTKRDRLGHVQPAGDDLVPLPARPLNPSDLLGELRCRDSRPYVVVKYAQTVDGRIATRTGDSKWISGEAERTISHALRAACDAVPIGVGTVIADDPLLTVRMVPGKCPLRVVLDSTLRIPHDARVLEDDAATILMTTERSGASDRNVLRRRNVAVHVVEGGPGGVDVAAALSLLRRQGVESVMVEGGAKVITSLLRQGVVDRLIVAIAPRIIGEGTQSVGDLETNRVTEGIRLRSQLVYPVDEDVLLAFDVDPRVT